MHAGNYADAGSPSAQTARLILVPFLLTFLAARILVLLIMLRSVPDLYIHVVGTHVHHLNFGIFLLSGVGAYLLFRRPAGRHLHGASVAYGVGLALTFDEFGMWLHLGGDYWQRASFDAIVVIGALLGLIAAAPLMRRFRPRHWLATCVLILLLATFGYLVTRTWRYTARTIGPELHEIEHRAPQ